MPLLTSIFLVISLIMAVVLGAQTRSWSWGPAMLPLGIAVLFAIASIWRSDRKLNPIGLTLLGLLVTGWFAWRAWISPVHELAQADLLLLAGTVATYLCVIALNGHKWPERIFVWGIALLLLANVFVVGKQIIQPGYAPLFAGVSDLNKVSGFYSHYNEAANYFIASSMLVLAAGLFGKDRFSVRIIWMLIAICGLVCIWYTRSRGGILGMAIALGAFAVFGMINAKRSNSRWFAPFLVILPVFGLAVCGYLLYGWQASQQIRDADVGVDGVLDNSVRLYFLGHAISSISLHPLLGGGSRSFSWECFQFADVKAQGTTVLRKPEYVHNELLQAATDYGLIGASLLIILLGTFLVLLVIRATVGDLDKSRNFLGDAWRLGAVAGLTGMLVQSSFSFVFHLFPGIVLLGICLGQMASTFHSNSGHLSVHKFLLTLPALGCALLLIPFGWKGTNIMQSLWPIYFSKTASASDETKIDKFTLALSHWPLSEFYRERAAIYQKIAEIETLPTLRIEAKENAAEDYRQAGFLHPFNPSYPISRGNLMSDLGRDKEAENDFARAIKIQGGMELAFRANFSASIHYQKKGVRLNESNNLEESLKAFQIAADKVETASKESYWTIQDMVQTRVAIHESLGAAREASGNVKGAKDSFLFATTLQGGQSANYRLGSLLGKIAVAAWQARRPEEALAYFIKAKNQISITQILPAEVTQIQRAEYLAYLDKTIAFLEGAKVIPLPDSELD